MTIELASLSDVDQTRVAQLENELTALLQEAYPELDLKRGVVQDLLLRPHAALAARDQETFARYLSANSLLKIEQDPTLADDGVVDGLLSNFLLTRQAGTSATGEITIVVSNNTTVTIQAGLQFTANGQVFTADQVYSAKAEESQITTANDRLLRPLSDGNFAFTIQVTAVEVGAEGLIRKDTLMIPETQPKNYVTSFASSDFDGGVVPETNSELISRLQQGIATKSTSNRINMQAMLRSLPGFETVLATSIVGFGDAEMVRDQHTIVPVSSGGVVDWFVRTQERLLHKAITMTATFQESDLEGSGIWSLAFDRDTASGFYEVRSIRLPAAENVLGSFEIIENTPGFDLTGSDVHADIVSTSESAFSRYQTAVVRFKDTETDHSSLSPGDTQEYDVEVVMTPQIAEIQDEIGKYDLRSHGSDVLVRGAIPYFVNLSFTIQRQNTEAVPDLESIRNALAKEVNQTPFIGRLFSSTLHDIVHGYLAGNTSCGKIAMSGRILTPDLTTIFLQSTEVLEIPTDRHPQVSEKTVQFYLDPEDVAVSAESSIPVPA